MLRILMVDFTNRTPAYNAYLVSALAAHATVTLLSPPHEYESDLPVCSVVGRCRPAWLRGSSRTSRTGKALLYAKEWVWLLSHSAEYDVVHLQWLPAYERSRTEGWLVRALHARNPRLVYTVHNVIPHARGVSATVRYKDLYQIMPQIIVHSDATRRQLAQEFDVDVSRVAVVHHGPLLADIGWSDKGDIAAIPNHPTFVMVGHLDPYKGVEDAIRAFGIIHAHYPTARLVLAGSGSDAYIAKLQRLACGLGLAANVEFRVGRMTNQQVVEIYRTATASLFPYRAISQSGAALTSLAQGVPIVGYRVGGLVDLVHQGVTGSLLPPGDIEGVAREGMRLVKEWNSLRRRRCREYVLTRFSWDSAAAATMDVYRSLLGNVRNPVADVNGGIRAS